MKTLEQLWADAKSDFARRMHNTVDEWICLVPAPTYETILKRRKYLVAHAHSISRTAEKDAELVAIVDAELARAKAALEAGRATKRPVEGPLMTPEEIADFLGGNDRARALFAHDTAATDSMYWLRADLCSQGPSPGDTEEGLIASFAVAMFDRGVRAALQDLDAWSKNARLGTSFPSNSARLLDSLDAWIAEQRKIVGAGEAS